MRQWPNNFLQKTSQFSNIWPLTRFLQIVIYIDAFNAKSYPDIDSFFAQSYIH